MKTFGAGYERDAEQQHWLILPRDSEWRKEFFIPEAIQHPAKMQLHIVKMAVEYYAQPGWKVLDPFAGTGSTALAATMGYQTTLIELEDHFIGMLKEIRQKWLDEGKIGSAFDMMIYQGDCRQVMKALPENHFDMVITSPPYSVTAQVGAETAREKEFTGVLAERKAQMRKYGSGEANAMNIGRLNKFQFNRAMERVYKECLRVLRPGGLYVSVTKDGMVAGMRQTLGLETLRVATGSGFEFYGDWFKWKAPGGLMQNVMKSKGAEVVLDEDIIVFRKP